MPKSLWVNKQFSLEVGYKAVNGGLERSRSKVLAGGWGAG